MSDTLFHNIEERNFVLLQLQLVGVTRVEATFSGGGDSGQIDEILILGPDGEGVDISKVQIAVTQESETFALSKGWVKHKKNATVPLASAIDTLANEVIDNHVSWDWYNNEGGGGTFAIDLTTTPPTITLSGFYNELVSTNVDSIEF